jgi:hypothetical protein
MLIPTPWTVDMPGDGATTTISTGHGESFKITIEPNPNHQPIVQWYLAKHPGVDRSQVLQYLSKKGYPGAIIAPDQLVTYVAWNDRVLVISYDVDGQAFINYRTTYYMMLNSLVLKGMPTVPTIAIIGEPFPPEAGISTSTSSSPLQPESVFPTPGAATDTSSVSGAGGTETSSTTTMDASSTVTDVSSSTTP